MKYIKCLVIASMLSCLFGCSKYEDESIITTPSTITTEPSSSDDLSEEYTIETVDESLFDASSYPVVKHVKNREALYNLLGYNDNKNNVEEPSKEIIRYYTYKNVDGEIETETWGVIHDDYWNYVETIPDEVEDKNNRDDISSQLLQIITEEYIPPAPLNEVILGEVTYRDDGSSFYDDVMVIRREPKSGNASLKAIIDIIVIDNVVTEISKVYVIDWR